MGCVAVVALYRAPPNHGCTFGPLFSPCPVVKVDPQQMWRNYGNPAAGNHANSGKIVAGRGTLESPSAVKKV